MIKRIVGAVAVVAVVWFIPVTTKAVESLIRSAIMSFGTAQDLTGVNIGIAKLILAVALITLVVAVVGKPSRDKK